MDNDDICHSLQEKMSTLQKLREKELIKYNKAKEQINNRKKVLENMLDSYMALLTERLNKEWMHINENLTKYEKKIQVACQDKRSSKNDIVIFPIDNVSQFISGDLNTDSFEKIFGTLDKSTDVNYQFDLKLLKSAEVDLTYINPLRLINDETALLCCAVGKSFLRLNINVSHSTAISFKTIEMSSLAVLKTGECIFTSAGNETKLKQITNDGSVTMFQDFDPLVPKAVCIANDEVYVGLREYTINPFRIERISQRQIMRLDRFGRTTVIYEFDSENKRLLTLPSRILADEKTLFVVDTISDDYGTIISLDLDKDERDCLKMVYNGYSLSKFKFCPNDMALSPKGFLIVADTYNEALHFVSEDGILLLYQQVSKIGISLPCSVCLDFRDRLWVGSAKTSDEKAKYHILSIT